MWQEMKNLEKSIILCINKKPKSITEISKETRRAKPTISKTVERMENQGLILKTQEYVKDARRFQVSINLKRIKIKKTTTFYLIYFILSFVPFLIMLIFSLIFKKFFLLIGSSIQIIPPLLYIIYNAYIKEDKILVEKNPKIEKKEIQKESENLLDNTN